jgi:hypothetical protein
MWWLSFEHCAARYQSLEDGGRAGAKAQMATAMGQAQKARWPSSRQWAGMMLVAAAPEAASVWQSDAPYATNHICSVHALGANGKSSGPFVPPTSSVPYSAPHAASDFALATRSGALIWAQYFFFF